MKYLGIDWAHQAHVAVLVDADGHLVDRRRVPHRPDDVSSYLGWLDGEGGPPQVRIGIESGARLLVEQLLARGYWVCVFNPKQAERCRDRLSASAAKDDVRDAHAIAEALRTDSAGHYRPLTRESPALEELRLADTLRTQAVQRRVRTMNQLWALLQSYYPALPALGRPCDDPFLRALLRAFPTPQEGRGATARRVGALLRRHRVRALRAGAVAAALRTPGFDVPEHVARICAVGALQLAAEIELLGEHVRTLEKRLAELFPQHPDHDILASLPGLGKLLAVRVGARLGTRRDPTTGRADVAIRGGTAPVTRRSGERRARGAPRPGSLSVRMRRSCDRVLQSALFAMARASLRTCPWARAYHASQIARGASNPVALRALSNKWARILDNLLRLHVPYDDQRHLADLRQHRVPWAMDLPPQGHAA